MCLLILKTLMTTIIYFQFCQHQPVKYEIFPLSPLSRHRLSMYLTFILCNTEKIAIMVDNMFYFEGHNDIQISLVINSGLFVFNFRFS